MHADDFMDPSTQTLVDFVLGSRYEQLGAQTVLECKRRLIDTLGCALEAFDDPLCATLTEMARACSGPQPATLWGSRWRSSPEMAAFANGVTLRVHDFNDTYFAADGAHPSDIIAAVLAAAEGVRADGRSLLLAIVTGYEVFCRFMQSVDVASCNFDQTLYASVAAALAVGRLAGLTRTQLGHAVALSIAPHLALRQTRRGQLSHWKGCAAADASRNAVFAVQLAQRNVTGPSAVFEGQQGLWSVLGGPFEWAQRDEWPALRMIGATHLKDLAVCYHAQSAAQAANRLHGRLRGRPVVEVLVEAYGEAVRMIGSDRSRWQPRSRETADHSLPFIVATCLVHGKVDVRSFDDDQLGRSDFAELMRKTRVEAPADLTAMYPEGAPARVSVRTTDGESLVEEVRFPKGHVRDPMNDAEIERKFAALCGGEPGDARIARALSVLWAIDECDDAASALMPALAAVRDQRAR